MNEKVYHTEVYPTLLHKIDFRLKRILSGLLRKDVDSRINNSLLLRYSTTEHNSTFSSNFNDNEVMIKKWDGINSLPEQWKLSILFVVAGYSVASDLVLSSLYRQDANGFTCIKPHDEEKARLLVEELEQLGLLVKYYKRSDGDGLIFFSYSREALAKLINNEFSAENRDKVVGEIYGYPQTAIKGYISGDRWYYDDPDLPPELKNNPFEYYLNYALSRDHWREELRQFKERVASLGQLMPNLIEKLNLKTVVSLAQGENK